MGSGIPQQPHTDAPASQREARARVDDHRRADMVIKADGIHSMAEAGGTDARTYQAVAVRGGHMPALTAGVDGADDLIGPDTVVVDDRSLTVLSACDDTHTQLIFAGRAVNGVQVADTKDNGRVPGSNHPPGGQHPGRAVDPHPVELARVAAGSAAHAHPARAGFCRPGQPGPGQARRAQRLGGQRGPAAGRGHRQPGRRACQAGYAEARPGARPPATAPWTIQVALKSRVQANCQPAGKGKDGQCISPW